MRSENFLELTKERRSVREFKGKVIPEKIIRDSLEAARWAPSGLNNQPWRFKVLSGKHKDSLSQHTKYGRVIKKADKLIVVFLDKENSYNYQKDLMAIGAAIQNILLYLWANQVGSCWLGEILNQAEEVEKKLKISATLKLAAVIAVGIPKTVPPSKKRTSLNKLILR